VGEWGRTSSLAAAHVGDAGLDVWKVGVANGAEAVGGDAGLLCHKPLVLLHREKQRVARG